MQNNTTKKPLNQNRMKTAVEYYNQEIKELFNMHQDGEISGKMFHMSRLVALTKAKEMEKEQIIEFADEYGTYLLQGGTMSAVTYNETFNKSINDKG